MFFSIPNLRATTVTQIDEPWLLPPFDYEGGKVTSKVEHRKWCMGATLQHHFLSLVEGVTSGVRVHKTDNPPHSMWGLVVDYDAKLPADVVAHLLSKPGSEFMPTYVIETFSGHGRLIWLFEVRVTILNEAFGKEFAHELNKRLKLKGWLAGLETATVADLSHYFELGRKWLPVKPDARIPRRQLELWALEAAKRVTLNDGGDHAVARIPIEDLAAAVDEMFPGRWSGDFKVGARGVRFWDPNADNDTSAIVMEQGMYCFTGEGEGGGAFLSWRRILGGAFVDQYAEKRSEGIISETAYDGTKFWLQDDKGEWRPWSKDDFRQTLIVKGFTSSKTKHATASEIDKVEYAIKLNRRVEQVLPFQFCPTGLITWQGKQYLNFLNKRPIQPSAPLVPRPMVFSDGRTFFPHIYNVLKYMFIEDESLLDPEKEVPMDMLDSTAVVQLNYMLAYLKYYYVNALNMTPKPGQVMILAGPPNKGKTYFVQQLIAPLLGGGCVDGSAHLMDGETWTADMIQAAVIMIDDEQTRGNPDKESRFMTRLKKYTANGTMCFNQKYLAQGTVPLHNRMIVTCNDDSESRRIIPTMGVSERDKYCLFKASAAKIPFGTRDENLQWMARDLPNFARFLLDWIPPEEVCPPGARFGVASYLHPDLYDESLHQGRSGIMLEVLAQLIRTFQQKDAKMECWIGTSTMLHADMSYINQGVMRSITPLSMATSMGILAGAGFKIERKRDASGKMWEWHIPFSILGDLETASKNTERSRQCALTDVDSSVRPVL